MTITWVYPITSGPVDDDGSWSCGHSRKGSIVYRLLQVIGQTYTL